MAKPELLLLLALTCALPAQNPPSSGVDLGDDQHSSIREVMDQTGKKLDDWIDRFAISGFLAARYFDTERGGSRPDGALGIQAGTLNFDIDVRDVASVFLEFRFDYFQEAEQNGVGVGEAYIKLRDVLSLGDGKQIGMKVGRFDLPFGEYYLLEDPDQNRLIGFPAAIPYRWDEGVEAYGDFGSWGFTTALTDGTYSRNSQSGIAPAVMLRLHARPTDDLYLSASGLYINGADNSAICFGGSVLTPVSGGAAGASPSTEVRSALGSIDLRWQAGDRWHLQASAGCGGINDAVDSFDRTIFWWMLEPTWTFAPQWQTTFRWSGAGTFDRGEGYQFESRPYGNGVQSYGFDLSSVQRVQLGVAHTFGKGLIGKLEAGFDHYQATSISGLSDDTRMFTAAELVLSF